MRAAEAVRDGRACGHGQRRQHRGHHGQRPVAHGPHPRRGPAGHRHPDPGARVAPRRSCSTPGPTPSAAPAWLVQFAQMGSAFARQRFGIADPRVGLLSIGEEAAKGNPLVKETHALLAAGAAGPGRALHRQRRGPRRDDRRRRRGRHRRLHRQRGPQDPRRGDEVRHVEAVLGAPSTTDDETRAAADVLLPALLPLAAELDPETYGGAMLLGVDGVCIISHGSSSARAIVNAVRVAHDAVERGSGRPAARRRRPVERLSRHRLTAECRARPVSPRSAGTVASCCAAMQETRRARRDPRRTQPRSTARRCSS